MTRVVAYLRVSTGDQADSGLGLVDQERKIRAYADLYDLKIVSMEVDAGLSAKTVDRPALKRALGMLGRGADAILVAKLDRLTRSVRDLGTLIEEYFTTGRYTLFSVADQVDTRSAGGKLVLNILASVSEWEREVIAERTKAALAVLKANNKRTGTVPLGYNALPDGSLTVCGVTMAAVARAKHCRNLGFSWSRIAEDLNNHGFRTQNGGWFTITTARRYATHS